MPFIWPPIMSVGSSRQVTAPSLADVTAADRPATEPQMTTTSHLSSVSSPAEAAAPTHRQQHEQQPPLLHWHTLTSSQTSLSAADLDLGPRWASVLWRWTWTSVLHERVLYQWEAHRGPSPYAKSRSHEP